MKMKLINKTKPESHTDKTGSGRIIRTKKMMTFKRHQTYQHNIKKCGEDIQHNRRPLKNIKLQVLQITLKRP